MAKKNEWGRLTPEEARTLAELNANGIEVYAAPIVIEKDIEAHKMQFESLGISHEDCKTWRIGNEDVIVHLTPAPKHIYDFLLTELRATHRPTKIVSSMPATSGCKMPSHKRGNATTHAIGP